MLPFGSDRCGGITFVSDLILTPAVTALLVSGLAIFGAVYTHRAFDITVGIGTLIAVSVLVAFYVVPTALIRKVIMKLKSIELSEIYEHQQRLYDGLFRANLRGKVLKEACEQAQYFEDVAARIRRIPNWPHFTKVLGAFGLSITPGLIVSSLSLVNHWAELFLVQR